MKYSIIIPVYNSDFILRQCVESIMNQSYVDFEAIFVDDGSTDTSGNILDEYSCIYPNMRVFHQANSGISVTRNVGIEKANGDYILFCDGDDVIHLQLLETVDRCLTDDTEIISFDCDVIKRQNFNYKMVNADIREGNIQSAKVSNHEYLANYPMMVFNKVFKREFINFYNIRFISGINYEDLLFSSSAIGLCNSIKHISLKLYFYIQHNNSFMKSTNLNRLFSIEETVKEIILFYKNNNIFERYYSELEWLAIQHLLYYTEIRLIKNGYMPNGFEFKEIFDIYFPDYLKCKYIKANNVEDISRFYLKNILKKKFKIVYFRYYTLRNCFNSIKRRTKK